MTSFSRPATVLALAVALSGCGGLTEVDATRKVSARDVVLDRAVGAVVPATQVDMKTKILASNVMVEPSSTSYLSAADGQSAFDELSLDVAAALLGKWNVENLLDSPYQPAMPKTGTIQFNADGTWQVFSGRIAAAGICVECSDPAVNTPASHTGTYKVYENFMVVLTWDNGGGIGLSEMRPIRSVAPQADGRLRIVFHGHGGVNAIVTGQLSAFTPAD